MRQGRHRQPGPQRVLRAIVLALLSAACGDRKADAPPPPAELRYDGATTISARILPALAPAFRAKTGVPLRIERSGAGVGLRRVLAGEVDVAGVSRSLTAQELARKPYFQIIGYDALAVYVNESNPVRALSRAQLKAIFTGQATSWKDVGGKPVKVVPCTERLDSERATLDAFRALAMGGAAYGKVTEREDPADCLAFVTREPGGIAAASVAFAVPGVRTVTVDGLEPLPVHVRASRYPLTRPLLLVAREQPAGPLAAFFELALSPEGQSAIANAGFVPAR
jgi:phosphate transport system substrate-binding protein